MANVIFVLPDPAYGRTRLRQSGAWLLFSPRAFAGCVTKSETNQWKNIYGTD